MVSQSGTRPLRSGGKEEPSADIPLRTTPIAGTESDIVPAVNYGPGLQTCPHQWESDPRTAHFPLTTESSRGHWASFSKGNLTQKRSISPGNNLLIVQPKD